MKTLCPEHHPLILFDGLWKKRRKFQNSNTLSGSSVTVTGEYCIFFFSFSYAKLMLTDLTVLLEKITEILWGLSHFKVNQTIENQWPIIHNYLQQGSTWLTSQPVAWRRTVETYLDTAKAVTEAGSVLSLRSYAVCIVNLLRNTSWHAHFIPEMYAMHKDKVEKIIKCFFFPPNNYTISLPYVGKHIPILRLVLYLLLGRIKKKKKFHATFTIS